MHRLEALANLSLAHHFQDAWKLPYQDGRCGYTSDNPYSDCLKSCLRLGPLN